MQVIIIGGPSGTGKSTVAECLKDTIKDSSCVFVEGDELHPESNLNKMKSGIGLTDSDREPWLKRIIEVVNQFKGKMDIVIVTCSMLKRKYRDLLRSGIESELKLIMLWKSYEIVEAQISSRQGHFFNPKLLQSQYELLEMPHDEEEGVVVVNCEGLDIDETVCCVRKLI